MDVLSSPVHVKNWLMNFYIQVTDGETQRSSHRRYGDPRIIKAIINPHSKKYVYGNLSDCICDSDSVQ